MSSTEQDPTSDTARRRFDEVASLFGPIVPAAGSPVRPRVPSRPTGLPQAPESELDANDGARLAPPPKLRAPAANPLRSRPAAEPFKGQPAEPFKGQPAEPLKAPPTELLRTSTAEPSRVKQAEALRPSPVPAAPRPSVATVSTPIKLAPVRPEKGSQKTADVPWPDAFTPRPNYKPAERSRWLYWAFLIPFAAVVAVAITFVNPRAIRSFMDQTLPQYLPTAVTRLFSRPATSPAALAPLPPAPQAAAQPPAAPPTEAISAPPVAEPAVTEPTAVQPPAVEPPPSVAPAPPAVTPETDSASSSTSAAQSPAPAMQGSGDAPAATASGETAPSPAPPEQATAPVPPLAAGGGVGAHVTIYYRRSQSGAEAEARRVAGKIGGADIKPSSNTSRSPMIYYFNQADRDAATAIARTLAGEGAPGWIVRPGPSRHDAGAIDILLP